MSDAYIITQRQWETLEAEALHERRIARQRRSEGHADIEQYWMGYEAACKTWHNAMRRINDRGLPPEIEEIITE